MQVRNKALAGIAVAIALAGCASQEKKQQRASQDDSMKQQKAQLAMDQRMAYQHNLACQNAAGMKGQSAGQAAPEVAPPSCNCSCTPEGSKSSVTSGKVKASATTKKDKASTNSLIE